MSYGYDRFLFLFINEVPVLSVFPKRFSIFAGNKPNS